MILLHLINRPKWPTINFPTGLINVSFICIFVAILWEALCTYSRKTINMFTYPPFKACLFATLATFRKKIFHHPGWEPVFLPPPFFQVRWDFKKASPLYCPTKPYTPGRWTAGSPTAITHLFQGKWSEIWIFNFQGFFCEPSRKNSSRGVHFSDYLGDRPLARGKHFTSTYYSPEI